MLGPVAQFAVVQVLGALVVSAQVPVLPNPKPQPVLLDVNQQIVVPRADPKLPSDEELARIVVAPDLVRLARQLDADAFADRQAARQALAQRKLPPDELMALLIRTDLGEEARHQLVDLLRDRILHSPRGALGIRMENTGEREGGVRIIGLVAEMPAERVLKLGDVVRKVNDTVLRHSADLVQSVQSLPPGVEVKLVVRRIKRDALAPNRPAPPVVAPAPAPPPPAVDGVGARAVPPAPASLFDEFEVTLRLGSTEELTEKGDPVPAVGAQGMLGGAGNNVITYERLAAARLAAARFLTKPVLLKFPSRVPASEDRPTATPDSVRKLLMELQLADGDADLVRIHRARLDQITEQMTRTTDVEMRVRLQRALEALETEIRGSF